jgi:hypothetical protein
MRRKRCSESIVENLLEVLEFHGNGREIRGFSIACRKIFRGRSIRR